MDAEKYARWIVANQDKKGTPEFNTVATAYKVARAGGIDQYAESKVGGPAKPQNPMAQDSQGNVRGAGEKFLIGAGKGFADLGRGIGQAVGLVPDADVNAAKERDAPIQQSGMGQLGQVASNVAAFAPTAFIPGANTYTGSALIGAGIGAVQPVAEGESRIENAGAGALGGAAGRSVTGGVSRMLNPQTSPQAKELLKEGVPLTPGQVAGGGMKRIEEGAKSLPVVGDFVRGAEARSVQEFNKVAINKALAPIGQKTNKIGHEGIAEAGEAISAAYDDVLQNMPIDLDQAAIAQLNKVTSMVEGGIAPAQRKRFMQVMQDLVYDKITPAGKMSGETFKKIHSALGKKARDYLRSQGPEDQPLGQAFLEAQRVIKEMGKRQHPEYGQTLSKVDMAYAQLLRVEDAATRAASRDGVFTANQLLQATKKLDSSLRKRATARGKAPMQDFAQTGNSVLANTVPDSGTPFRLANMALMGGGVIDPATAAMAGAGAGMAGMAYTRPGVNVLAALLAKRPDLVQKLGKGVALANPGAGLAGAITVPQ